MLRRIIPVLAIAAIMTTALACGTSGATGSADGGSVASSGAAGGSELTGTTWQWTASTTKTPASQSVVPDPENYTILFNEDGTYAGKADCNQIVGAYMVSGSTLSIQPGAGTLAACPEESQSAAFISGLIDTSSYAIADGELTLTLVDEGTMTFSAS